MYQTTISKERFADMQKKLIAYVNAKKEFDSKVIQNDKWYRAQHWDFVRGSTEIPETTTSFLFNALAYKHAEIMDNYPSPNVLAREENDVPQAEMLSQIIPFELDACNFKDTFSKATWYKLKNGVVPYGVFFNPELNSGLGDIDIQRLDILNIFWEPGVEDIQNSRYLFLVNMVDNNELRTLYPHAGDALGQEGLLSIQSREQHVDFQEKSLVVDCYYKVVQPDGKKILHMTKFTGDTVLDSSEDRPQTAQTGLYAHGHYPVIFDVLYPMDGTPVGFGLIDLSKNCQTYVDKLDSIISENALISGKVRWLVRDNGGINEEELLDLSQDIVHVTGSLRDENVREFQANPLDPYIIQHRLNKIEELKELTGNRDFMQGGSSGGVTAYGAIVALQEAGNKLSRDIINNTYESYKQIIYMCISLIRQFFDEDRQIRITGEDGSRKYIKFSNKDLLGESVEAPVFDIKILPEKSNPFTRLSQNQMAQEFYNMGMFRPENAKQAIMTLSMMSFEGKDKLIHELEQMLQEQDAVAAQTPAESVQKEKTPSSDKNSNQGS
ncbi:MAG: hypothetical protein HFI90_01615 [Clostridia bacterium]|nr:hypothetical protein [Clostridia bacterium]